MSVDASLAAFGRGFDSRRLHQICPGKPRVLPGQILASGDIALTVVLPLEDKCGNSSEPVKQSRFTANLVYLIVFQASVGIMRPCSSQLSTQLINIMAAKPF